MKTHIKEFLNGSALLPAMYNDDNGRREVVQKSSFRSEKIGEIDEDLCNYVCHAATVLPEVVEALLECSRALAELDPLGKHHDAKLVDEALSKSSSVEI
jgi:hypothetical protein